MLVNKDKITDYLVKVKRGEIEEGLTIGFEDVDTHIRFKRGNFNVITGHANVGKTHIVLYLMYLYGRKHKLNWLIYSSENTDYSIMRKIIEFHTGLPLDKIPEKDIKRFTDEFSTRFKIIDTTKLYSYKDLLTEAKGIYKEWKFDGFLIDPYNSLIKKTHNAHEYDYQATTEMRLFCKVFNVSIWLNTHAVTEALRKKHPEGHQYAGHPIPPSMADVESGGKFGNRADDFFCIHRYTQHRTDWVHTDIHVRKIKDLDTGGRPTNLDEPVRLTSLPNRTGFCIGADNLKSKL
jgi:hypothetical protein